jgi:glycosyltransferase involved in cell wall biosynthesis
MKVLIMTALYPKPENPAYGSFVRTQVEFLRHAGVDVEVLVLQGRFQKWQYASGIFQLRKLLSGNSIELVHTHYGYTGMVARTQWSVPIVATFHGDDLLGTVNERGHKTFASSLVVAAGRALAGCIDAAIVQSKEMAGRLPRGDVFIIPHEVDFQLFRPIEKQSARAALGLDPQKKYLLFAANPAIPVKRFSLAKAVADELYRRDSSTQLLTVYKEPQDRLALFMNACDALVFTSYQEGSPNIVKQAMACNLPIVSTDVGDVREIIANTQGCYICRPDLHEFLACLATVLRSGSRTNGRDNIRHLSGPAVARRIIEVYEHVLRKRKGLAVSRRGANALPVES